MILRRARPRYRKTSYRFKVFCFLSASGNVRYLQALRATAPALPPSISSSSQHRLISSGIASRWFHRSIRSTIEGLNTVRYLQALRDKHNITETLRTAMSQHRPISSGIASCPRIRDSRDRQRASTPSDIFRNCELTEARLVRLLLLCLNTVRYLQELRGPLAQGQISSPLVRHSARGADNRGFRVHRCRAGDAHLSTHLAIRLGLG